MSSPLLEVVTESVANIALPMEETDEWVAVDGGGFERATCDHKTTPGLGRSSGAIRKRGRKKPASYFVNHCENTACDFPPGHAGLCSHQIVQGERRSRYRLKPCVPRQAKKDIAEELLWTAKSVDLTLEDGANAANPIEL